MRNSTYTSIHIYALCSIYRMSIQVQDCTVKSNRVGKKSGREEIAITFELSFMYYL